MFFSPRAPRRGGAISRSAGGSILASLWIGLAATFAVAASEEWIPVERIARGAAQPDVRTSGLVASDSVVAVGSHAPFPDGVGRVTIFSRTSAGLAPAQVLLADSGILYHGSALALDGDLLVAGSYFSGVVYVYRFDGTAWIHEQRLDSPSGSEFFGYSVAIAGGRVLVGAFRHDQDNVEAGAVYSYEYDGSSWVLRQTIRPAGLVEAADFGFAVAGQGDTLLVGAPGQDGMSPGAGVVYVFGYESGSWTEKQQVAAPDPDFDSRFGSAIACDADRAIFGMLAYDGTRVNQGAAYVFEDDGAQWVGRQRLTSPMPQGLDQFSQSIALEGELAFIGQRRSLKGDDRSGRGVVFRYDGATWNEVAVVGDAFGSDDAYFGGRVAIAGESLVSVASGEAVRGAIHVHELVPCVAGSVTDAGGLPVDLLYVDGSAGQGDRTVVLDSSSPLEITLLAPLSGGSGRFVLHGNVGAPRPSTEVVMPAGLGTACFEFRLARGAMPVVVANSLGRPAVVGSSVFYGSPQADPSPATTVMSYPSLPRDTVLTLQAVIFDPASSSSLGASITNAVIVRVP